MAVVEEGPSRARLLARVKAILLNPRAEWEVIDAEPATVRGLYRNYVLILAAIGPLATLIGGVLFGYTVLNVTFRPDPLSAILGAALAYAASLAGVYVIALVINGLAPTFGGQKNLTQAMKVSAYSWTAAWVVGIFALYPPLMLLGILGLYSFYLLYLGLPRLMKSPPDKALGYTAVAVVIGLVLNLIIGVVAAGVTRLGMVPPPGESGRGGTLSYQGQELNVGKAAKAVEDLSAAVSEGAETPSVSAELLQTLLPSGLAGGFTRTAVSSASGGVGGYGVATARGVYAREGSTIELEVSDIGPVGALAGAFNVKSSEETAQGYEKIGSENGRTTYEKYDRPSKSGEYSVVVGGRFMVEANGDNITVAELQAAVKAVDFRRLEAMAKG